jgi:hypothetical protein
MCDVPTLKTINHQFWIDHELAKVKDEKRRAFLYQHFSGDEGIDRFYEMMRNRKGVEFANGTWPAKVTKITPKQVEARKRPCVGCGFRMIKFKPWGEIYDEFVPICPSCEKTIAPAQQYRKNQNSMTATNETEPLKRIQSAREQIKNEVDALKTHFTKQLQEARTTFSVLTSAEVGVSANELLAEPPIAEVLKLFQVGSKPASASGKHSGGRQTAGKKKKVRDWICDVLKGGGPMTRPEIEAAIKEGSGKKPYNVYKYVQELLKEGVLAQPKKGTFNLK